MGTTQKKPRQKAAHATHSEPPSLPLWEIFDVLKKGVVPLGELLGVDASLVSRWKAGKRPMPAFHRLLLTKIAGEALYVQTFFLHMTPEARKKFLGMLGKGSTNLTPAWETRFIRARRDYIQELLILQMYRNLAEIPPEVHKEFEPIRKARDEELRPAWEAWEREYPRAGGEAWEIEARETERKVLEDVRHDAIAEGADIPDGLLQRLSELQEASAPPPDPKKRRTPKKKTASRG